MLIRCILALSILILEIIAIARTTEAKVFPTSGTAKCSSGRCCDVSKCQMKSAGTQCRPQSNDCDISESCNGVDARCPTDRYKPDGTDCTNIEAAYCYMGQCRSHRSQCELLWGPGTQVSDKICYTYYNVMGLYFGNCGTKAGAAYIKCDEKDALCGRLQCQDIWRELYYYKTLQFVLEGKPSVSSSSCHSIEFDVGIGTQDPGLVPQGAKCGDRQMCVNQKCINVTPPSPAISLTASGYANEGTFGVYIGKTKGGVLSPLPFDGVLANRLSRYDFSTNSFKSSLFSISQFFYTEICIGVPPLEASQLKTIGAYPPLSFDWMSTTHNGGESGCRGGVLSVSRIITIFINQNGRGVLSSMDDKETSWSMFSVTDTMKYDSQLLCVFGARASSDYGALPFSNPLVNPTSPLQLYNAATTAYTCGSSASAYFVSMSVGVPAGKTATVQLVVSGFKYTFEMTRQNTDTTGTTTLARTVLVPCTSDARMILIDGEVVPGTNLISYTAFPYELKTGTSVAWAGYGTTDIRNSGTMTYDLLLMEKEINFQIENSVVQIPVSGYYYVYISAGVCPGKQLLLSVLQNGKGIFGLACTATDHNGLDTIGHGMVILLSQYDQLSVYAYSDVCSSNGGLHTSFIGILLYQN